jgi:small subunit ribosomal protein S6
MSDVVWLNRYIRQSCDAEPSLDLDPARPRAAIFPKLGRDHKRKCINMPFYEHVIISRPDISPQQVEELVEGITTLLGQHGGKVSKVEYWGLRNLAYRINKTRKGHYSLLNIDAPAPAVHEMERLQRINEHVMRYMTIAVEELEEGPSPVLARRERDEKKQKARSEANGMDY